MCKNSIDIIQGCPKEQAYITEYGQHLLKMDFNDVFFKLFIFISHFILEKRKEIINNNMLVLGSFYNLCLMHNYFSLSVEYSVKKSALTLLFLFYMKKVFLFSCRTEIFLRMDINKNMSKTTFCFTLWFLVMGLKFRLSQKTNNNS